MNMQTPLETGFKNKPEASEVISGKDLSGMTAVVTGGYSGIGKETVRALTKAGANVIVPARNKDKAVAELNGIIDADNIGEMDLADINSVDSFASDFIAAHNSLDILINNAGVMACPLMRTNNDWEWQIGVNHFGHAQLFHRLLPLLQKANGARFVSLSSSAHRMSPVRFNDIHYQQSDYEKWQSYGQSKTACSLMAVGAQREYSSDGIESFAVHPGGILTPLQRHLENDEMVRLGWINTDGTIPEAVQTYFKTPSQGAATSVWCATADGLEGKGGVFCEDCNISNEVSADSKAMRGRAKLGSQSRALRPALGNYCIDIELVILAIQ